MPQSLAAVYLHAVFSTKDRRPYLSDPALRRKVHAFVAGVSNRLDCPAIEVGGVDDHVHLLARLSRTVTIADWMKEVKRVSSTFIKESDPGFAWQAGYGVFSIDQERLAVVCHYIRMQENHHQRVSFQDEFRELMADHGIELDERYAWD